MQLGTGQHQALAQKQTMSPQMFQQMRLLELPVQELSVEVQNALEKNPALEIDEGPRSDSSREVEGIFNDPMEASDRKQRFLENIPDEKETLHEHLFKQLDISDAKESVLDIAEDLVQNLNDDGFNILPPSEAAKDADPEDLDRAIKLVQGLDPQGTCTSGWKESILVQAKLREDAPEGIEEIITNHLEELSKKKYAEAAAFINTLDPYPARNFWQNQYIYPDLKIIRKNGKLAVFLRNESIPTLKINPSFENFSGETKEEKKFVKEKIQEANTFIDMLRTRDESILKTANALIALQHEFFEKGPKYMIPLTLKDVAEKIGVHETTVSRIANGKYIQTDWGVYRISSFFPSMGESNIETIKEIIEENKGKKLSDQQISDLLKEKGIEMARRTVSKYRRQI